MRSPFSPSSVPSGWKRYRLKQVGSLRGGSAFPDRYQGVSGNNVPFFKVKALGAGDALSVQDADDTISAEDAELLGAEIFPAQTIVFAKIGAALLLSRFSQLSEPACIDNNMMAVVARQDVVTPRFMQRLLSSFDMAYFANPGAVPSVNVASLANVDVFVPSIFVQQTVTAFLDCETASADALINDLNDLSRLLEERRLLLITRAVTKGLNLRAPMKATTQAWAREIPSHWSTRKLSQVAQQIGSGTTPPADEPIWYDGPMPFLTTTELRETTIPETARTVSLAALKRFSSLRTYPAGSVVIAMYGATIGRLGILGIPSTVNQACCVIQGNDVLSGEYLYYWLMAMRQEIVRLASGGGQPNISQDIIRSLRLPLPPIDEQRQIVAHLKQLDYETVSALDDVRSAILFARQRRSALISAAVTGQIERMMHSSNAATAKEVA